MAFQALHKFCVSGLLLRCWSNFLQHMHVKLYKLYMNCTGFSMNADIQYRAMLQIYFKNYFNYLQISEPAGIKEISLPPLHPSLPDPLLLETLLSPPLHPFSLRLHPPVELCKSTTECFGIIVDFKGSRDR